MDWRYILQTINMAKIFLLATMSAPGFEQLLQFQFTLECRRPQQLMLF